MKAERLDSRVFAALTFVWTFVAFLPALRNGFVDWDDGLYLVSNEHIRGFSWEHLRWALTTVSVGHYIPLTWLSFMLDFSLWGLSPAGFHLTNVLLHALNAALFFFVSRSLLGRALPQTRNDPAALLAGAAASALFFSLHPLRVESVAWVFERKDVLCGLFYLAAVWAYVEGRRPLALAFYGLSLVSKAMGIGLPLTLLALDLYPLKRRASKELLVEKLPFAAIAAAAAAITYLSHERLGATMHWSGYGLAPRLAQASFGLAFYLWKTALPWNLSPRYASPAFEPFLGGAFVAALAAGLWSVRRRFPAGVCALAWYGITLLPVLGFIPQSSQLAADRYSYLSCLPWALLAGAGVTAWMLPRKGLSRGCGPAAASAVLLALSAATVRQTAVWRDSTSLWTRAAALDPRDVVARNGLGRALATEGSALEAEREFQAALEINPSYPAAHNNLGALLAGQGRLDDAILHFRAALEADPGNDEARRNLERAISRTAGKNQKRAPLR